MKPPKKYTKKHDNTCGYCQTNFAEPEHPCPRNEDEKCDCCAKCELAHCLPF